MHTMSTWVQSDRYEPNNPYQHPREAWVTQGGQGGYASFYWDQVPNPPNSGLLGTLPGASMSGGMKLLLGALAIITISAGTYGVARLVVRS